jgi:hypothetical protein
LFVWALKFWNNRARGWKTLLSTHSLLKYLLPSSSLSPSLPFFSPISVSLSANIAFLVRSGHPWSRIKGNWWSTAAAPALLLFSNQCQLEAVHTSRPETHKLSSPSLFLLFLLPRPSLSLVQGYSMPRLDGGAAQQWHGSMTVVALQGTMPARLIKRCGLLQVVSVQAPPRE